MGEKIIPGHKEGETQEQRAWFNFSHLMSSILRAIDSEEPLTKKKRNKLFYQVQKAADIRVKYDEPAATPLKKIMGGVWRKKRSSK